ncbi:hypothetical protein OSI21_22610 [Streptomyces libani]|nr:hypothetical protein [Streptomyces libani]MCX5448265.1 hypothetical protein [Streptomyces libani]
MRHPDQKAEDVAERPCAPFVAVVGRQQQATALARQARDRVVIAGRQPRAVLLPPGHQPGDMGPDVSGVHLGAACQQPGVSAVLLGVQPGGQQQITDRGRAGVGGRRDGRSQVGVPDRRIPGVVPGASGVQQRDAGVSQQQRRGLPGRLQQFRRQRGERLVGGAGHLLR